MNKTLICFCSLLLVILLTACESNVQNQSSLPPSENIREMLENQSNFEITAVPSEEPANGTELPTVENSPTPIQESSEPILTSSQNSISNEKAQSTSTIEITNIPVAEQDTKTEDDTLIDLIIHIGDKRFAAKLFDSTTTQAWIAQMPITLDMSEMNGNEKYYYLSSNLPTASERVGSIHTGDLMLYGSDCLVLFYENFQTSYSYTKLGYIVDDSGLVDALGSNGIDVTFSIVGT